MEQIKSCANEVSERIETKAIEECLVQRRVGSRIINPPIRYGHCDIEKKKKRETNDGKNYSLEKRIKLNTSMQHKKCVARSTYSSNRSGLLVFDKLDFRGILSLRQTLRLANLQKLAYAEEEQNRHNVAGDSEDIAENPRNTEAKGNWNDDTCTPGLAVSKHLIERLQTLARLGVEKVHFAQGQVSGSLSVSPRDISEGQEAIKVIVTNEFDDPPVAPAGFTYITSHRIGTNLDIASTSTQCDCKGSCRNVKTCLCASLNGSEFPYTHLNGGRLIESRDIVFECGPRCGCGPNCGNRVSQKPLKYRLEVYRTAKKGWAVRTWDFIPSGAPVVEYIGVLNRCDEIDNVDLMNEYIFDIDCLQTINGAEGREKRKHKVSLPSNIFLKKQGHKTMMKNGPEFCIDASKFGNVSRFINHGCEPNLFVQCVLSSYHDIRLARVVLFAAHDIQPNLELTYDYGYALDSVVGPDGQIKQLPCHCGAATCRKRLY